jgi:hypothetical protein
LLLAEVFGVVMANQKLRKTIHKSKNIEPQTLASNDAVIIVDLSEPGLESSRD